MSRCLAEQKTVNFDCCLFQLLEKSQRPIFDHRVVELEIWNAPILKDLRCVKMSIVILLPVFQVMLIHHCITLLFGFLSLCSADIRLESCLLCTIDFLPSVSSYSADKCRLYIF